MITPTLGRIVWFQPHNEAGLNTQQSAIIARVNDDGTLNLTVFAPDGYPYGIQNVPLLQDDDPTPVGGFYAEWMPYQKGQAAKTEAAEAAAGNAGASSSTSTLVGEPPSLAVPSSASSDTEAGNVEHSSVESSTGELASGSATEQPHESIIERLEDGAEHLKEDVVHVFHHDGTEGEQSPTA